MNSILSESLAFWRPELALTAGSLAALLLSAWSRPSRASSAAAWLGVLAAIALLADASTSFRTKCIDGLEIDRARIELLMRQSLMLVTALNRSIGYDNAAKVAKKAYKDGTTLRAAAIELGLMTGEAFDRAVRPEEMIAPKAGVKLGGGG